MTTYIFKHTRGWTPVIALRSLVKGQLWDKEEDLWPQNKLLVEPTVWSQNIWVAHLVLTLMSWVNSGEITWHLWAPDTSSVPESWDCEDQKNGHVCVPRALPYQLLISLSAVCARQLRQGFKARKNGENKRIHGRKWHSCRWTECSLPESLSVPDRPSLTALSPSHSLLIMPLASPAADPTGVIHNMWNVRSWVSEESKGWHRCPATSAPDLKMSREVCFGTSLCSATGPHIMSASYPVLHFKSQRPILLSVFSFHSQ